MDLECVTIFDRPDKYNTGDSIDELYSLAELNDRWEDYEPKDPLIKDEKIREAVRAWAEANCEEHVKVRGACLVIEFTGLHKQLKLELSGSWTRDGVYTIDELCGEDE